MLLIQIVLRDVSLESIWPILFSDQVRQAFLFYVAFQRDFRWSKRFVGRSVNLNARRYAWVEEE